MRDFSKTLVKCDHTPNVLAVMGFRVVYDDAWEHVTAYPPKGMGYLHSYVVSYSDVKEN